MYEIVQNGLFSHCYKIVMILRHSSQDSYFEDVCLFGGEGEGGWPGHYFKFPTTIFCFIRYGLLWCPYV